MEESKMTREMLTVSIDVDKMKEYFSKNPTNITDLVGACPQLKDYAIAVNFNDEELIRAIKNGIEVRETGVYYKKAFYLPNWYDWKLAKDEFKQTCLIPTKKLK